MHILGSTRHPDETFMRQVGRTVTAADDGALVSFRVLICDRDRTWSRAVRDLLEGAGIWVVRTPFRAPNANAPAERFVRSIKEACLTRIIPLGESHLRHAIAEFVDHDHRERHHQGIGNERIDGQASVSTSRVSRIRRRQRLGGLLNYYARAA